MTRTLGACFLSLVLAACGGASAGYNTTPSNTTVAPAAGATFELGEMTVFDGPDAMLKVHADGSTELGGRESQATQGQPPTSQVVWKPGPMLKPDGTIEWQGKAVAKLADDGTLQDLTSSTPSGIHVTTDELAITDHGQTTTLALSPDGKITITNAPGKLHDQPPHVEGADTPGKRRTVLTLLALLLGGHEEVSKPIETSGPQAPAPTVAPAPAPAPAPGTAPAPAPATP
jgi:hypothetical protein